MTESRTCKNCGRANPSNSERCAVCGMNLAGAQASGSRGEAEGAKKSNKKLYLIIGGIAGFLVIGGFLMIFLAAGVWYLASVGSEPEKIGQTEKISEAEKTPEIARDDSKKESEKTEDESVFAINLPENLPSRESGKITDAQIVEYLKNKKNVGAFRFVTAASQDSLKLPKKMFALSEASAYASYLESPGNESLIMFMGVYESAAGSKADYTLTLGNVRKSGAKNIETASKDGANAASFSNLGQQMFLNCRGKTCILVTSKKQDSILRFINAMK